MEATAATTTTTTEKGLGAVKHVLLVLSGKGGVGKSTVSAQLARSFARDGRRVGLLDVDLCGPSIPKILGLEGRPMRTASAGWVPVHAGGFPVASIGFLTDDGDAPVIWRGPKKNAVIRSLLEDVLWGALDVLVVDTPPGTSDEHISTVELLLRGEQRRSACAVLVTTPQHVAVLDVRKELSFCRRVGLPVLGVLENMSGFACAHCGAVTNVFSSEGGRILAEQAGVPFLGKLPIDPALCAAEERGEDPFAAQPLSPALQPLAAFTASFFSSSKP